MGFESRPIATPREMVYCMDVVPSMHTDSHARIGDTYRARRPADSCAQAESYMVSKPTSGKHNPEHTAVLMPILELGFSSR